MPHDYQKEPLTLQELADRIGPRRGGQPTHVATIRGWIVRGIRKFKLNAVMVGGIWRTTWADYQAFVEALTDESAGEDVERQEAAQRGRRSKSRRDATRSALQEQGAI